MELDAKTIEAIWRALQRPAPDVPRNAGQVEMRIAKTGWATSVDLEDLLLSQDRRTDPPAVIDTKAVAAALGLQFRLVFARPKRRGDDGMGLDMLSATDTAALCIWLERLGFHIDVSALCSLLRPRLEATTHLSDEEISIAFYEQNRRRLPPVTLSAPRREWRGVTTSRHKTLSGYRLEYVHDDDGRAVGLTVRSPKYRRPAEQSLVKCPECGMSYVRNSRTDEQLHRSFHRKRSSIVYPKPHHRFAETLARDHDAAWVNAKASNWKRKEIYDRALEFKRELGYDFVQWSVDAAHDPDPIGFLFSDELARIVGACSFRPQTGPGERPWRLDWVWISPGDRRQGHLDRHWQRFRQRFGVFDIEPPISDAMRSFLRKHDGMDLIL